ncbi:Glycosyltransferase AglD [uncultured archaeon]|nr:Glycosyltransferase AglD [uncultured archaeon]
MIVSVVIPVYNEEENVVELLNRLTSLKGEYEFVIVDDGSTDKTFSLLEENAAKDGRIKPVHTEHLGQSSALQAGFTAAGGEVVVTMDGDLQYDPADIPSLVDKLSGFDLVCGRRMNKKFSAGRVVLSDFANLCAYMATGVRLHDQGCTFKAYRKEAAKSLRLKGFMHRYITILLARKGYKVTETPVKHYPRLKGKSKYGYSRIFTAPIDFFRNYFLAK